MRSFADTRSLFKADAAFEAVLGTLLLAGALARVLTSSDIPVARPVIACAGIIFLLGSASQAMYFINRPRRVLAEVAIGNAAMTAAGLVWLLVDYGFSATGGALLSAGIVWKLAIALLQTNSLRPRAVR